MMIPARVGTRKEIAVHFQLLVSLQGRKLFVIMAINLSLGESIILQPIIPAVLQPKLIHIVNPIVNYD